MRGGLDVRIDPYERQSWFKSLKLTIEHAELRLYPRQSKKGKAKYVVLDRQHTSDIVTN